MSVITDPEVYERFEHVMFVHGVRWARETAVVRHRIEIAARARDSWVPQVRDKLRYYPTVTREPHANRGRLPRLIESGRLARDLGLPPLHPGVRSRHGVRQPRDARRHLRAARTRAASSLRRTSATPGDYVIERAFVTR